MIEIVIMARERAQFILHVTTSIFMSGVMLIFFIFNIFHFSVYALLKFPNITNIMSCRILYPV